MYYILKLANMSPPTLVFIKIGYFWIPWISICLFGLACLFLWNRSVSFPFLWQNTREKQKRKDWFWFIISEISVHGPLALLFLDQWWDKHHGKEGLTKQSCSPCGSQELERKNKVQGTKYSSQGHTCKDPLPLTGSHLIVSTTSQ